MADDLVQFGHCLHEDCDWQYDPTQKRSATAQAGLHTKHTKHATHSGMRRRQEPKK